MKTINRNDMMQMAEEAGVAPNTILHFEAAFLRFADLLAKKLAPEPVPDSVADAVRDAVAEALGDAYDCGRVWSAWSYGTMGPDDFSQVAQDSDRVDEIAQAAIAAMRAA